MLKKISQRQQVEAREEDEELYSFKKKEAAKTTKKEEGITISKNERNTEDNYIPPPGAPPVADEASLSLFYSDRIPTAIDLKSRDSTGRVDLEAYIFPFRGTRKEITEKFGQDYSEPLDEWFEKQIDKFYETVTDRQWNPKAKNKPGQGYKKVFARACRSGTMYRCGLRLKTAEQLEVERIEQERVEKERLERERKEREEWERKAEQIRKEEERDKELIKRISKEPDVMEYLYLAGVYPGECKLAPYIKGIRVALRELRERYAEENILSACKKESRIIESECYRRASMDNGQQ